MKIPIHWGCFCQVPVLKTNVPFVIHLYEFRQLLIYALEIIRDDFDNAKFTEMLSKRNDY
jgi:hypothetical protein